MKFSDISAVAWDEHREYWDTCLLPVTGLTGEENPQETTAALERLRDAMDKIEIPYKGRIVTYPAFHYSGDADLLGAVCGRLKGNNFRFVFLISADLPADALNVPQADLILTQDDIGSGGYKTSVTQVWAKGAAAPQPL